MIARGLLLGIAAAVLFVSCGESSSHRLSRLTEEETRLGQQRKEALLSKHPGIIPFQTNDDADVLPPPRLTIDIAEEISARANQRYWIEAEKFDVYRNGAGQAVLRCDTSAGWLELESSPEQLARIREMRKPRAFGARFMFVFTVAEVRPVSIGFTAEPQGGDEPWQAKSEEIAERRYRGRLEASECVDPGTPL